MYLSYEIKPFQELLKNWQNFEDIFFRVDELCQKFNLNPIEILALIKTESNGIIYEIRYERNFQWLQKDVKKLMTNWNLDYDLVVNLERMSFGLCQIMCSTMIDLGYDELPIKYLDIKKNIEIGIKYWIKKKEKWGNNPYDIYAAYNAGTLRKKDNWYVNSDQVSHYKRNYEKIKEIAQPKISSFFHNRPLC